MSRDLLDYFRILKQRDVLGTSYLFVGKNTPLITDIIKLVSCPQGLSSCGSCWDCRRIEDGTHPDLFVVEPDGFSIKIDKIREGMRFFSLKSYRLKNKVMFIKDAWAFSPAAANAFLKTLEEPPRNSFIAIATSKLEGLLPTIISRCRKIFLPALPENLDRGTEESVSAFLRGEDLRFPDRKKFSAFLWELITVLRRGLLSRSGYNNKRLPGNRESEIIVNSYSLEQIAGILKDILEIYGAAKSINMNLALNLIRLKL